MRILHTMIRCGNLDASIEFYTKLMGMKFFHKTDYPKGKFTLAFLGYGDDTKDCTIELTYNWGVDKYDLGNGFGHIALEVDDVYATCDSIKKQGGNISYGPGPSGAGASIIAFVTDPDGYKIELINKK